MQEGRMGKARATAEVELENRCQTTCAHAENGLEAADVSTFITYRLNVVSRLLDRQTKAILANGFDLTIAEWRVLSNLKRSDMTANAISHRTFIAKSQVSRAVAELIDKKYVRKKIDSTDARQSQLTITKQGLGIWRKVMIVSQDRQNDLLARIPPDDREPFFRTLDHLTQYLLSNR